MTMVFPVINFIICAKIQRIDNELGLLKNTNFLFIGISIYTPQDYNNKSKLYYEYIFKNKFYHVCFNKCYDDK